ncbi:MAG: KH domain-containing protein [Candidatus Gracilibacteria bacterium]|nr:KH domain-containing protein [Candidatus Gracilibacteria bacterium]
MKEKIQELCEKFFTLSGIKVDALTVSCEDQDKNIFFIKLETPDSKLIIGTHGQTLDNIKHLLNRMIESSVGKNFTIHVEVNDYLKLKDEKLYRYIDGRIDYITKNGKSVVLPNFTPYERKKIHSYISDKNIEGLKAHSEGEGKERFMHISYNGPQIQSSGTQKTPYQDRSPASKPAPRSRTIDIDIDGIDI